MFEPSCNTIEHNVIQLDTSHKIKYNTQGNPLYAKLQKKSRTYILHYKDEETSRT